MNTEIYEKLTELAFKKSKPFCYQCYCVCPAGVCKTCGSDDLMRLTDNGCEYGIDWVIKEILETELEAADLEESFEQSVRECYPETTTVGWCEFDTVTLLKEQDPISWRCALADYESQEADEGNIISFDDGDTYYYTNDIQNLLKEIS